MKYDLNIRLSNYILKINYLDTINKKNLLINKIFHIVFLINKDKKSPLKHIKKNLLKFFFPNLFLKSKKFNNFKFFLDFKNYDLNFFINNNNLIIFNYKGFLIKNNPEVFITEDKNEIYDLIVKFENINILFIKILIFFING